MSNKKLSIRNLPVLITIKDLCKFKKKITIRRLRKIILRISLVILAIFLFFSFVLSISPVQTRIATYITESINTKYNTHISISKVDLSVFGKVAFENISVLDNKLDTLINISSVRGNFDKLDVVGGKVKIDDLFLINPYLSIKIYENDTISNLNIFINSFNTKPDSLKKKSSFDFASAGINVKGLFFDYQDFRPAKKQYFKLSQLDLVVDDIVVNPENIHFNIDELQFNAQNGFKLKKFRGDFIYSQTYTQINNLELVTENSKIKTDIKITYPSFEHVVKKSPQVKLDFNIDKSLVSLKDINYFYPISNSNESINISMKAKGNIDRLTVSELNVKTAQNSEIIAQMDLYYILSKEKFDFNIEVYKLSSNYSDLINLLPKKLENYVPTIISKLGNFDLTGKVKFKYNYLNSNLFFNSEIGNLTSNLEVNIKDSINNANYTGNIKVEDFDLKTFLDNDKLGVADLELELKGKGFTLSSLDSYIDGTVKRLQFNGYEYNDISIEGEVKDKLFKGNLDIKDNNISLSFNGLVDAQSRVPNYKFDVYIDNADLVKTNLFTRDSIAFLEGSVDIDLKGKSLEDLVGTVNLRNIVYQNENDLYYFDEFNLNSSKKGMHHKIEITSSDVISGKVEGDFYFYDIVNIFKNAIGSVFRNYKAVDVEEKQNMLFDISFKNKIIDVFFPEVSFDSGTKITGNIDAETNHLKLKFDSSGIEIEENRIDTISLWVDNKSAFFNTLLKVKKIETKSYSIHDLNLAVIDNLDSLHLSANFSGGDSLTERYKLRLYQTLDENSNLVLGFLNSEINFLNNNWAINPNNENTSKIVYNFKSKNYEVDSIYAVNKDQSLLFYGKKENEKEQYYAHLENVKLETLIPDKSKIKPKGNVNADIFVDIIGETIKPVANLTIDSLSLNSNYMGDLAINMLSDNNNGIYKTGINLVRSGLTSLDAEGIIDLTKEKPSLDIDVDLDKLRLKFVNIFTKNIFNNIRGYASGKVNVSGPITNPNLNGFLDLQRASIGIDYLKVNYNIEGTQRVFVKNHVITVPSTTLRDSDKGTKGSVYGTISNTNNYKQWDLDLNVQADKLLVLNTTEDDNPLYYGSVYVTGMTTISGPTSKLIFDIAARTEKGTVFSIPLQNNKIASQSSFIHFLPPAGSLSDKEFEELEEETIKEYEENLLKGLNLTFNLEITPDAQVEIVFDEQVGDVMKASGNGVLKMDIDTKGDFSMYGSYSIDDGEYLFTMQNLVNKKFKMVRGSTITWNGDPLEALLDVNAVYKTKTQVASYLDYASNESYNKLLVELILKLSGQILKPEISFDIKIPDAEASLQSQLEMKLNESDEERSRQFIMLITLNSFATSNSDIAFGGSVASSTAEMFANQFSNIASGISDKFDVNIGYSTANSSGNIDNARDNSDELEVGVSSRLFNDRITVNGNVGVPVGSSQSSIVGDVEVLIDITKDGRYKGKVFTRQNVVTDLFASEGYTQGIGISYQTNFDSFEELINNLFKRKPKKEQESFVPEISIEQDTTTVKFK